MTVFTNASRVSPHASACARRLASASGGRSRVIVIFPLWLGILFNPVYGECPETLSHYNTTFVILLEMDPATAQLGSRIVKLYSPAPIALPLNSDVGRWDSASLAAGLASLGYPGFRQLTGVQPQ